ncbi:MAG: adenylate/guanylate cyclase domain-containing protein [Bacteroidia bacterium]|nr:adenylate/guanylate cyclase domain-containing protein [Bacteroidia bacterium]
MIAPTIPDNEVDRLAALYALNLKEQSKEDRFDKMVNLASSCLKVPIAYVATVDKNHQLIHASCGLNFVSSDRTTSFCGHAILQDAPLIIPDTHADDRFHDNPLVVNDPFIRFYAGYPLTSPDGFKIGTLCIADHQPRVLTKAELEMFMDLGFMLEQQLQLLQLGEIQLQLVQSRNETLRINKELDNHNQFFQQIFGRYMSQELLSSILSNEKNLELGGEEREATVMMSDLRGFTPMAKRYGAQRTVEILNMYLEEMIDIIQQHGGFINEILGDGILVVFGVPHYRDNPCYSAVMCAKAMHDGLERVNEKLKAKGYQHLEMGIGINSGNLIAGNIGSSQRMKYGVIGDTVNLAARIESFTVGGQTLVSERTYENVQDKIEAEGNLRVKIKGYKQVFKIFDLSSAKSATPSK